jgi:hypothetical protein
MEETMRHTQEDEGDLCAAAEKRDVTTYGYQCALEVEAGAIGW